MQEIIKQIDELTESNRVYRREMNEKLCEIRNKLGMMAGKDTGEKYWDDAWRLVRHVAWMNDRALEETFGTSDLSAVFRKHTSHDIERLLDERYGAKDETSIKPGDRVDIYSSLVNKLFENYIFIGECEGEYLAVRENDTDVSWFCKETSKISKRKE